MLKKLCALGVLVLLSACGGGGGGGGSSTTVTPPTPPTPPPPVTAANVVAVTIDAGPASISTGANGVIQDNLAYVSVTLCAPGTTNCQTIDHVQVDTGSVGLRIAQGVLNASLLSALPIETDASANPVAECYGFVDGYTFGSVRQADFQIGGETVADMPLQIVGDTGVFSSVPSSCSSGAGTNINTVLALGANGIIGIGVTANDCGADCATASGSAAATYYDCPSSGCSTIIARAATTTAPFQQLPNPVAAMSVDNNGSILELAASPAGGETTGGGNLIFGIGTQSNNALGSATVLTTTTSLSSGGAGFITAIYKGQDLDQSFLDSGSNLYIFIDNSIPLCTGSDFTGYYCPSSALALTVTLQGLSGMTADGSFTLNNAKTLLSTSFAVLPGIGGNPNSLSNLDLFPSAFDYGLPFFYGRNIYTAIEGRNAGGTVGPYYAY